ncbi:ABC transporter permease [Pseudohoeflea suaedae]|uniref:ABC transporter permease n=1 Tax=Pseudohoeflea suaedae TaxID=877384 RepID=A0A4R5PJX9_9HYPH|nr:ABC transporter permease [Pseudohoeflea suaedae]TDH35997.1 ABC transporter permease [Pseudohoeflea suaedae]
MAYVTDELIPPAPPPTEDKKRWTAASIAGAVFLALWFVAAVAMAAWLVGGWNTERVVQYGPKYLSGLVTTIELVATCIILGAIISIPVAFGRMSNNRILSTLSYAYVYFFRGTPLIAQLFLIYYGLGSFRDELDAIGLWVVFRDAWNCAVFAFSLNTAAYQAEILRGAIQSVPRGQFEGAASLGLGRIVTMRKVIFPQAMIVALRPYGNEIILMIKASAIVSIVTVFDLMGETRRTYSRTFDFQTYIWAAIFYLLIVEALRNVWVLLEKRLTRHLKR